MENLGQVYFPPEDPENIVVKVPGEAEGLSPQEYVKRARLTALKIMGGLTKYLEQLETREVTA